MAIILAGGRSSRMGGVEKAFCRLAGRPMIEVVTSALAPQVGRIVINANGDAARFHSLGLPVVADGMADYQGPLAGVLAGLEWAKRTGAGGSHVLTVPVDVPFLPADLVARLARHLRPGVVVVAASGGRMHPVVAAWPMGLAADLAAYLEGNGPRKVATYVARHPLVVQDFDVTDGKDPFANVNTPDELAAAERVLAGAGAG